MQVFVGFLKYRSPPPQRESFGHGWIENKEGKRWHPCISQKELLKDLSSSHRKNTCLRKVMDIIRF